MFGSFFPDHRFGTPSLPSSYFTTSPPPTLPTSGYVKNHPLLSMLSFPTHSHPLHNEDPYPDLIERQRYQPGGGARASTGDDSWGPFRRSLLEDFGLSATPPFAGLHRVGPEQDDDNMTPRRGEESASDDEGTPDRSQDSTPYHATTVTTPADRRNSGPIPIGRIRIQSAPSSPHKRAPAQRAPPSYKPKSAAPTVRKTPSQVTRSPQRSPYRPTTRAAWTEPQPPQSTQPPSTMQDQEEVRVLRAQPTTPPATAVRVQHDPKTPQALPSKRSPSISTADDSSSSEDSDYDDEYSKVRRAQERELAVSRFTPSEIPAVVGLENPLGSHNCFMNVVLQSLWHLTSFREAFESKFEHVCARNLCLFCALKNLFAQFRFGDFSHIPPKEVRLVVSRIFAEKNRFQMDRMDDAAELLDGVLSRLHLELNGYHDDVCQPACIVHSVFGAEMMDQTGECESCLQLGDYVHTYTTFLHYFPAALLLEEGQQPFEQKLRSHFESDFRFCEFCERNEPNAKRRLPVLKYLLNEPQVIPFALAWHTAQAEKAEIAKVMQNIPLSLQMDQVYRVTDRPEASGRNKKWSYALVGAIFFYGLHYVSYFYHAPLREWLLLDDAVVRRVGSWSSVVESAVEGRHMPLVLFYAKPNGRY